jgi:hypothetical protein
MSKKKLQRKFHGSIARSQSETAVPMHVNAGAGTFSEAKEFALSTQRVIYMAQFLK